MEILYLVIVLIINGAYCGFLSAVFQSIPHDELIEKIESGDRSAQRIMKMKQHFDETVDGFQMVETFFYIIAATLTGAVVITEYNNWYYVVYSFGILIFATFILRSLFNSFGWKYGRKIAFKFILVLTIYSYLSKPFLMIVRFFNNSIAGETSEEASREELTAMVESAREEGSLDDDEYRILKNIMHFSDVLVTDVMTPRTVVFSCEADKTVGQVVNMPEIQMYSRFPIWEGESLDDGVVGYVMSKDVLHAALIGKQNIKLRNFAREVYFIPENSQLDTALELFLKHNQHQFLVVDEYGGIEGLLTMEDVIETMLGVEIVDEADKVVDLRRLAKEQRDKRVASIAMQSEKDI
jgi:CBS domain containing-hemolysin-like protein